MHHNSNDDNVNWRGIGIYGYPKRNQKHLTCNLINNLSQRHSYHNSIIFGDLNIMTNNNEKIGGDSIDPNLTHLINNAFLIVSYVILGFQEI